MRLELAQHLTSTCLAAFRMLQDVVDPKDLPAAPAHAAGVTPKLVGCVVSPEADTMVLMLVGLVGIYFGSSLYLRRMRRKDFTAGL